MNRPVECKSLFISIVPEGREPVFIPSAPHPRKVLGAILEETSDCMGCLSHNTCCVGLSKPPGNAS